MQNEFNEQSQKIVNWEGFRRKQLDLEMKQYSWKETLFQLAVEEPYRIALWIGRTAVETVDFWRGKPAPKGDFYFDTLNGGIRGDTYFDRDTLEGDLAFFGKHGLNKAFQQKAAKIAREAFDAMPDMGVLVKSGQLQKFNS